MSFAAVPGFQAKKKAGFPAFFRNFVQITLLSGCLLKSDLNDDPERFRKKPSDLRQAGSSQRAEQLKCERTHLRRLRQAE